jgi:hypothetical protein
MTSYIKTMREAREEMLQAESMSAAQIDKLKKAYEPMRDKRISTANANKLSAMMDKFAKDKDVLIQLFKADIPFVSQSAVTKLIIKYNMKGAELNKLRERFGVESVELDEMKSKNYALAVKGKFVAVGSKADMMKMKKQKGGEVYMSPGAKVGGSPGKAEDVDLDEALNPKDKKVVDAFYDGRSMDGKMLSTDGKKLEKTGMGGQTIASKSGSKFKIVAKMDSSSTQDVVKYIEKSFPKNVIEEVDLDEAKYDLYHKDFSSAMQHAYKMAKKLHGITISPDEISDKVATGPRKPSEGKTNKYRLEGDKGGIQIQVYNKGGSKPFELNMYKEEVELDEKLDKEDEPKVKEIIKKLKGASQAHAGQAKDLQKAVTEKDELDEAVDKNAADELKMYIENDAQLYKSQLIPIVKNMQRKMKSGKYDHRKAPKLWMYLVDAGAKKYVKEFGGDVRNMFDKQTRQYVAQQMADEYKDEIEAQGGTMFEEVGMDEAYSPKQIKMAIGIASDPRYKGGNYSGAVKAIEKIKGGLSQDKQVAAVLKRQNEALGENLDGRTREYRQHRERLESLRSKRLEARHIDPADIDTSATDDDIKSAGKNIMMQLRKSVSLRGQYSVEFLDKKKVKVPQKIALAVIAKYNSLKKPMDKEKFQAKIAKSHKDLLMGLKESLDEKKKKPVVFKGTPKQIKQQMKNLKKKDKIKIGEESTLERMNKKLQEKKNG